MDIDFPLDEILKKIGDKFVNSLCFQELLKIVYIDEELTNIQDTSMVPYGKETDGKNGVRCMQISGDGQLLATGDRSGNLR